MSKTKQILIKWLSIAAAVLLLFGLWGFLHVEAEQEEAPFEVWQAQASGSRYFIDVRSSDIDGTAIPENEGKVSINGYDIDGAGNIEYYPPSPPYLGAIRLWSSNYNAAARNIIVFKAGFQTSAGNTLTEELAFECNGTGEWTPVTDDAHIAIWPITTGFIDIRSPQCPDAAWDTSVNEGKVIINGHTIENTPTHTDYYYGGNDGAVRVFPVTGTWNDSDENTLVLKAGFSVADGVSLLQDRTFVCMGSGAWTEKVEQPPVTVQDDAVIDSVDKFAWAQDFGYYLDIRSSQFLQADQTAQAAYILLNGVAVGTNGLGLEFFFDGSIRVNTYGEGAWEKIDENGYQTLVFKKGFMTSSAHRLAEDVRFICKLTANPDGAKPASSTNWTKVGAAPANFSVGGVEKAETGIADVSIIWGDNYFGLTKTDLQKETALLEKIALSTDSGVSYAPITAYDSATKTGVKISQSAFSLRLENYTNDVLTDWTAGTRIRFAAGMQLDGSTSSAESIYILQEDGTWLTEAQVLAQAKTDAIAELQGYKTESDYLAENWVRIEDIISSASEQINAADSQTEIGAAVTQAKADIDEVPTLRSVKDKAIAELNSYKSEDNYSAAKWAEMQSIIEDGTASINAATTLDAINSAVTQTKTAMDKILTKEQEAQALEQAKADAIAALGNYVSESDYSEANWAEIESIISAATAEIYGAATETAVAQALSDAKTAIDDIPTSAEEAQALEQAKADAIKALDSYVSEADYSEANWAKIESIISAATAEINSAANEAEVAQALSDATAAIDDISTSAEEAQALEQAKKDAVAELNSYKEQNDYTAENSVQVESIAAAAIEEIKAAASETLVAEILLQVKTDIDAIVTLNEARSAAIAALNEYKAEDDYSAAKWALIEVDIEIAAEKINAATTQEAIDAAVAEAKLAMDAVETKEQETAKLNEAKQQAAAALDAYKDKNDYTAENWARVQEIVAQAKENILAATSVSDVQAFLAEAKEDMDAVPTAESDTDTSVKSGCSSSLYAGVSVLGATLLAAATLFISKKNNI